MMRAELAVEQRTLAALEAELARRASLRIGDYFHDCDPACQLDSLTPDHHVPRVGQTGPTCRGLYPKHLEFFRAGKEHRERLFLKANRVGGSEAGVFETTLHLTGEYPPWWEGRRFEHPVLWWTAGDTSKTVRDILQEKLLGPPGAFGTGMVPAHRILHYTAKAGIPDAIETVWVRHVEREHGAPAISTLQLKSYDQRREAFQGTAIHGVHLDEECPMDIYTECVLRTMTTNGLVLLTFTPIQGLTELVLSFLPGGSLS